MTDNKETSDEPLETEDTGGATDEIEESLDGGGVEQTSPESTEETSAKTLKKRRGWVIFVVILVSFVAGAGAVGYWGWVQLKTLKTELANVEAATGTQVAVFIKNQKIQRSALIEDVDSRLADVDATLRDFASTIDSLSTLVVEATQSNPDGLIIAEVDYLLQLANHRIVLEHNRDGALLAIGRAQSRLESSATGAFRPILDQMAKDRAALEAAATPNVGAIVGTLAALLGRVDDLGADGEKIAPQGESPNPEEREASGWDAFVSAVGQNLSQFVEIKAVDGAAAPTLIPNQEYFARENVRISLQNARASAVRRDTENFRLALAEASRWLGGHFASSSATSFMQEEIERLGGIELAPVFPDLDVSLGLVRELSQSSPAPSATEIVEGIVAGDAETVEEASEEGVEANEGATQ